ncbi:cytochrome c maturation protein CcmE [Alicyclobacillus kakegawensis]|uniref:cytochrome c maturation protein CcmE n=1 Tax=Alicyclobacillus kakegawensis TaxID=392012 RepID=UPI000833EE03|nr:cytochrome c maturation protein CcmE [Alicyclobacillus kakegawensis]
MSVRIKLVAALVLVVGVLAVLIRTAVTHAATYYMTVAELTAEGARADGQEATVSGDVVAASVRWQPEQQLLQFTLRDPKTNQRLPVVFHGPEPDDFANDWPVIVTGKLQSNGRFVAHTLLVKCPSKYEAQPQQYTAASAK